MSSKDYSDAIAMLKAEHRGVEALFEKFKSARGAAKQAAAEQVCTELHIHMQIEEEIFYPAVERAIKDAKIKEAFIEHDSARVLINDIMSAGRSDDFYEAKVKVLSEEVEHHVREEEERVTGLFSQARDAGADLVTLRDEMLARRAELETKASKGRLGKAEMTAVVPEAS